MTTHAPSYIPSTEAIRKVYAAAPVMTVLNRLSEADIANNSAAFDRWLAEVKAEVRGESYESGPNADLIAAAQERAQTDSPTHALIRELAAALVESDAKLAGRLGCDHLDAPYRRVLAERDELQARIHAALAWHKHDIQCQSLETAPGARDCWRAALAPKPSSSTGAEL